MSVICPICASPSLRGHVDADVVRRLTLSDIAKKHGLSSRAVRRHVAHLPERIEADASASRPSIYIGQVTYNINLIVSQPEEEEVDDVAQNQGDPEEDGAVGAHG